MGRGRTVRTVAVRHRDGEPSRVPDELIVEEPMEVRLDGHVITTTMRTPGHDFELAAGFCHSDGLLAGAAVIGVDYCETGLAVNTELNVVSVSTGGRAPKPTVRLGNVSSSCGLCGSTAIESMTEHLEPLAPVAFDWSLLEQVTMQVTVQQELFVLTGASHGAAAFDITTGKVAEVREDIGRHNAVDKVVGALLLDERLPALIAGAEPMGLWVSGRASFEMVQKAWAGGFVVLASVSAPSALAVGLATEANIALAGFARDRSLTVYNDPLR